MEKTRQTKKLLKVAKNLNLDHKEVSTIIR